MSDGGIQVDASDGGIQVDASDRRIQVDTGYDGVDVNAGEDRIDVEIACDRVDVDSLTHQRGHVDLIEDQFHDLGTDRRHQSLDGVAALGDDLVAAFGQFSNSATQPRTDHRQPLARAINSDRAAHRARRRSGGDRHHRVLQHIAEAGHQRIVVSSARSTAELRPDRFPA